MNKLVQWIKKNRLLVIIVSAFLLLSYLTAKKTWFWVAFEVVSFLATVFLIVKPEPTPASPPVLLYIVGFFVGAFVLIALFKK